MEKRDSYYMLSEKKRHRFIFFIERNKIKLIIFLITILIAAIFLFRSGIIGFVIKNLGNETSPLPEPKPKNETPPEILPPLNENETSEPNLPEKESSNVSRSSGGGGGGGSTGGGGGTVTQPTCTNDSGCLSVGSFCDNNNINLPYNCSLGSDGCLDRTNLTTCGAGYSCIGGSWCIATLECTSNANCSYFTSVCAYGVCNASNKCVQIYNSSTQICRNSLGECDPVEYCTGYSAPCPSNIFNKSWDTCSFGICDGVGSCVECLNNSDCLSGETCYNWKCIGAISCKNLNQSNKEYILNSSIRNDTLTDACIKISAENITLDCKGYSITSSNDVAGIYSNQSYTTVKNCNISVGENSGGYGVYLEQANNSYIFNNTLNSQYAGIFSSYSSNCIIENNIVNYNTNKGIHLLMAYNNTIENNEINNGSFYGLVSAKSANNIIQNNNIIGNVWYGILIEASLAGEPDGENQILDNLISSSRENIYVKTSGNIIKGNTLTDSQLYNGLYIYNVSNNTIENNILNNNKISGLGLNEASNNVVINNTLNYNEEYGIEVYSSNLNTIENNTASSNSINGLYVEASSDNAIKDNVFCNNTEDVYCDSSQTFENNNCDSGSVCGGSCQVCGIGGLEEAGITGAVINIKKGMKDYLSVIIFIVVVIVLAILVNLKKCKKK